MKVREKDNGVNQSRKKQGMRKLAVMVGWLLCMAVFVSGGFIVFSTSGKYNLQKQTISYMAQENDAVRSTMKAPDEIDVRRDGLPGQEGELLVDGENGQAKYEESIYSYKGDILTFLLIGVKGDASEALGENADGSRVQALSLLVLDPQEKAVKLISINCNTMAAVDVYDEQGMYAGTVTAQVGIRRGFDGDGKISCEYQVKAVQNLFYGIPISGYLAADMDAVSEIAALIDGMDAEVQREISADGRIRGQEYLLAEFIGKGIRLLRKDPTAAVRIYNEMSGRMTMDITADEVAYLTAAAGNYRFDSEGIITIPEARAGKEEHAAGGGDGFYVDEEALYRLVLDIFYEPVG